MMDPRLFNYLNNGGPGRMQQQYGMGYGASRAPLILPPQKKNKNKKKSLTPHPAGFGGQLVIPSSPRAGMRPSMGMGAGMGATPGMNVPPEMRLNVGRGMGPVVGGPGMAAGMNAGMGPPMSPNMMAREPTVMMHPGMGRQMPTPQQYNPYYQAAQIGPQQQHPSFASYYEPAMSGGYPSAAMQAPMPTGASTPVYVNTGFPMASYPSAGYDSPSYLSVDPEMPAYAPRARRSSPYDEEDTDGYWAPDEEEDEDPLICEQRDRRRPGGGRFGGGRSGWRDREMHGRMPLD